MKIVLHAEYYEKYLEHFYAFNNCDGLSYLEHLNKLLDDYFGSFVSYHRHFEKIGYQSNLIIANDFNLQNKWLVENGFNFRAYSKTKHQVVLLQVQKINPDLFFMGSMFEYYGDFLVKISLITKNIFTWISCPYPKNLDFSFVKCVISSNNKFTKKFKKLGLQSEVLAAAFDSDILKKISFETNKSEVSFIGGLGAIHKERVDNLKSLINKGISLDLFGYGLRKPLISLIKSPLEKIYKGELWGMEMYNKLARSNISLNFHIKEADGQSGNMRMYEATGCGSLLLTENTKDLNNFFEPYKEVVPYDSIPDLKEKIDYYSKNKKEAQKIAKYGQKKCLEKHGYNVRIIEFDALIKKHLE
jgi:spore maturation protein CgeB